MNQMRTIAVIAAAGMCAVAHGETIDLDYIGVVGGTSASHARVASTTYYAGHMTHTITSGDRAGESFNTFCIELGEHATNGSATYEIVDLASAPSSSPAYGQAVANAVSAVVANAYALGWIDARLQSTGTADNISKMGAIQAAVWEALGHDFQAASSATSNGLETYYNILTNVNSFDSSARMAGLRAVVADGQQDMLFVVPLPSSALAGLGLLGGIAGVRTVRRRG
ncbi:MAG: Cys-Gln thioester bond-forming surface protein [Phycisphaerales bacterium]